jgi:hypothetical protein
MAWFEKDPHKKMEILFEAEQTCPGMSIIKENILGCLMLQGREVEAIKLAKELLTTRPTARVLFILHLLTDDKEYIKQIEEKYSIRVVNLLEREVAELGRTIR